MKIRLLNSLMLLFLLSSCQDIFHEPDTSIGDIRNDEQLIEAAEGAWGAMALALNYPDPLGFYYQNVKGDDLAYGPAEYIPHYPANIHGRTCFSVDRDISFTFQGYSGYAYESLYRVIASANNIITQFPDIGEYNSLTQEIVGEMLLLRAYCHFRLMRTYGQIPIVDDIEINYELEKPGFIQIYDFIERDLKRAVSLLPLNAAQSRIPGKRPGKSAVKTLLAEVYLNWAGYPVKDAAKYVDAAREAGNLIDSADHYELGLLEDYAHLWDDEHRLNNESVFTLYFSGHDELSSSTHLNWLYLMTIPLAYPFGFRIKGISRIGLIEPTFFASEVFFFNHYPEGYRKDITFFNTIYVPEENYFEYQVDTGVIHLDTIGICERVGYRKFYYEESLHPGAYSWYLYDTTANPESIRSIYIGDTKVYLYRFAHTLLTYAEAKARSGHPDENAYEAINRIRRRARNVNQYTPSVYDLTPGLSADVFADSVVWERAWELAGEPEGRYFDLLRLEKLENLRDYRHPEEMSPPWRTISRDEYFLPIPEEDVFLNPNFE